MSILNALYVSTPEQARGYRLDLGKDLPAEEHIEFSGLTPLEFSILQAILQNEPWTASFLDGFEILSSPNDDPDSGTYRLPSDFVATLAALEPERTPTIAKEWAQTEEMRCAPETARGLIEELTRLAELASRSGRQLYFWYCL